MKLDELVDERYQISEPRPRPRDPGYARWRFRSTPQEQEARKAALWRNWTDPREDHDVDST